MSDHAGKFVWYDVMTTDTKAGEAFYRDVIGWKATNSGMSDRSYTIFSAGEVPVGGLMPIPEEARAAGAKPHWTGYIAVDDVDAYAKRVTAAGGAVHRAPEDIPGVGRFAVVADPHGAELRPFQRRGRAAAECARARHPRPCRLARAARGRPAERLRLLFRAVRLDQGGCDGYGRDGRLSDLRHRRHAGRRHDDEDARHARAALALLLQRRCH